MNDVMSKNVLHLDYGIFRDICQQLDLSSKWRELAALADGSRYALDLIDVERCAKVLYTSPIGSPSAELLKKWGNNGMTCDELVSLLNQLNLERPLKLLREPEELQITQQPIEEVSLSEGEDLVLTCEASGFPFPCYTWFKEQQQLIITDNGQLVVNNIRVCDSGKYVCRIHHINHKTNQPSYKFTEWCTVTVRERLIPAGQAPVIVRHPVSQTMKQNDQLVLSCEAEGLPAPEYHWYKDKVLVARAQCHMVAQVSAADDGNYCCCAVNSFGQVWSNVARIVVLSASSIQVPANPEILRQPVDQSIGVGGVAVFAVEANYPANLSFQWFHNSKPVPDGTSCQLHIPVEDACAAGEYQCRVYAADKEVLSRPAKLKVTPGPTVYTASDKVALIIGVSTYKIHGVPLPAVQHDLQETVKVFEEMQFKVVSLLDLTLAEMKDAIDMFCDLLTADVYAVFYCAGHGFVGNDGKHYLIPWDAGPGVSPGESLCIEATENQIQQKQPKLLMFFLDICRRKIMHQAREMPVQDLTVQAVANKIVIYAASEGQQAYEENKKCVSVPRGLFNQYLLEVISKPRQIIDLYCAIIDKFKASPYDRVKFPQCPEMKTNVEDYGRTLRDPISTKDCKNAISYQTQRWIQAHRLPRSARIPVDKLGEILVTYTCITSNVMDMTLTTHLVAPWWATIRISKDDVPAALRPVEAVEDMKAKTTRFRFPNLQRLRGHLTVYLCISLRNGAQSFSNEYKVVLNLEQPLVAALELGQAGHLGPLSDSTDRKQPMEHIEDHSLPSLGST